MLRTAGLISMIGLVFGLGSAAGSSSDISPEESKPAGPAHLVVASAKPAPVKQEEVCPADMVLVEGEYCPEVKQHCLRYMDGPGRYEQFRCAEYAQPAKCTSNYRVSMRFCMDRDEYAEAGESRPANFKSFNDAKKTCSAQGKRVCAESEWNFACEGEEMRPYPYGFKRDPEACNADLQDIVDTEKGKLYDLRAERGSHPKCESPFGVRDMSGNLEEFVAIDGTANSRPAMKGAYWQPGRNFCRAAQTAHDSYYNGMETGFRCCADAE
ncbi:MAG: SUMF1/EgtB/PvdO family nonheme iron enzyme [Myxococcales bacterium]|nr:SUMF1/EgtB/PvdO family nonheme iron enzyme [Myxococcales bacterium]